MLDKEIIQNTRKRYTREEARELLTKTWLERPREQRNHLAAERFDFGHLVHRHSASFSAAHCI